MLANTLPDFSSGCVCSGIAPHYLSLSHNMIYVLFGIVYWDLKFSIEMNRIKEVLEEKGIKQTWLAEKLEKSYNMVNSYAQNRRQPSIEDLNRIAKF